MRFAVGDVQVDVIVDDDDFELPLWEFLPDLDLASLAPDRVWLEPGFVDLARGILICAIQSFVLRTGGRTILVDSCIGEGKDRPEIPAWNRRSGTGFLDRLRAAGVDPAAVDTVLYTHLHIDHVGWNTIAADGSWAPTFPNARYLAGRTELADWQARMAAGTAPALHVRGLEDSVLPLVSAGCVDLVDDGLELAQGMALTFLPGHTMGQMGLRIDRTDARAVFCVDAIHSPVQFLQPAVSTSSCMDQGRAAATRRTVLEEAAATGRLVIPAHFRGMRRAHVRAPANGFRPRFPT